jgi:hypothetical protein
MISSDVEVAPNLDLVKGWGGAPTWVVYRPAHAHMNVVEFLR